MASIIRKLGQKKYEVIFFSSTAIALYGYDQGMMSLINTNYDYLHTMGLRGDSPLVGVIVSVYYLGCTAGSVLASWFADRKGRKPSILACLATAALGDFLMFIAGLGGSKGARELMLVGRVVMGLGVGGIDAVVPVYSSELASDEARGKALAQEFQMNIFGLLMAFAINLGVTIALGKSNQWAWRIPIIVMQVYPFLLFSIIQRLPETPRWFVLRERNDDAKKSLDAMMGDSDAAESKLDELVAAHKEESGHAIGYMDMLLPKRYQFHPTAITVMGQINQALTGYGAVSVYGPQIFELLGFGVRDAEFLTLGNYVSYFLLMTLAWILIDRVGRRVLMLWGSAGMSISFALLTVFGGVAMNTERFGIDPLPVSILGTIVLFVATVIFGDCWLATVWLIPTEIYPSSARAQGAAISVIVWGIANFAVTLLTPIGFNNLNFWLFLVFSATNAIAGILTWAYSPESGGRSFEENQRFFQDAREQNTWRVGKVNDGEFLQMPQRGPKDDAQVDEQAPLLTNTSSNDI